MKREMTKEEKSLLMYLETRAVDYRGRVDGARMNKADFEIARKWDKEGYVKYGRIKMANMYNVFCNQRSISAHYVILSDEAWEDVAQLRMERAKRHEKELDGIVVKRRDVNFGRFPK